MFHDSVFIVYYSLLIHCICHAFVLLCIFYSVFRILLQLVLQSIPCLRVSVTPESSQGPVSYLVILIIVPFNVFVSQLFIIPYRFTSDSIKLFQKSW